MKTTKKLITLLLALLMVACFGSVALAAPAAQPIKITVDGHEIYTDVEPQSINNRTMVPIRVVSEALMADVVYHTDIATNKKEITITTTDGKTVKFQIGSKKVTVIPNSIYNCAITTLTMDVTPQVKNNRTLIPIRFAAVALDSKVGYDAKTKTVAVNTPALTVDGKELNTMTTRHNMFMGGITTAFYGNAYVEQAYKTLTENKGKEVPKPSNFGEMHNLDDLDYYDMDGRYSFHTGNPTVNPTTGEFVKPAVETYEIYWLLSSSHDNPAPEGYTAYLLRDVDKDKWYQYEQSTINKLINMREKMNSRMSRQLFNNVV